MEVPLEESLRSRLICQAVFSCIAMIMDITLTIAMALSRFTGVGQIPIVISNCTNTYYSSKYSKVSISIQVAFIPCCISIILAVTHFIILLTPLISKVMPTQARMNTSLILSGLQVLCALCPFGRFLNFQRDFSVMNNCTVEFNQDLHTAIIVISSVTLLASLILITMTMWTVNTLADYQEVQLIYREVGNLMTTITDQAKPQKPAEEAKHSPFRNQDSLIPLDSKIDHRENTRTNHARQENRSRQVATPQVNQGYMEDRYNRHRPSTGQYRSRVLDNSRYDRELRPMRERGIMMSRVGAQSVESSMASELHKSILNKPGPIRSKEQEVVENDNYASYIRRMNSQKQLKKKGSESSIIASIRGKYRM